MKIELGSEALYERYKEKRENLPLYYCYNSYSCPYFADGRYLLKRIEKGFYRCEDVNDVMMKVYDTYAGTLIRKDFFNERFKKPSKLKLFLYKHFPFLWI